MTMLIPTQRHRSPGGAHLFASAADHKSVMSSIPHWRGRQQPALTNDSDRVEPSRLTTWLTIIGYPLAAGVLLSAALRAIGIGPTLLGATLLPLSAVLAVLIRRERQRSRELSELADAYHGTALVLGKVVRADSDDDGKRQGGLVALCLEVADHLHLSAQQRRNLELGALLHDVGQIAVPKEIIEKPGKLDPAEWSIVRAHTLKGQKLLDSAGELMHRVGQIVRSHHERWDGAGYPDGLAGEQIPIESRIIACCDTWTAMRSPRSYRSALPFDTATAEMRAIAGSQLDPRIVTVLIGVVDEALHPLRARAAA